MSRGPKMGDDDACIQEGIYFVTKGSTLRKMAKVFNKSPSTIKKDLDYIEDLDKGLYAQVRKQVQINLDQRCFRGGESTREKFLRLELAQEAISIEEMKNR